MAKCTICNSRKGKRKCKISDTFICSQCCGQTRQEESCMGCPFFKGVLDNRNYRAVPYFTIEEMSASPELDEISGVIELALCKTWVEQGHGLVNDRIALQLMEKLLDRYHFKLPEQDLNEPVLQEGIEHLNLAIRTDLYKVEEGKLVKVMAAVYRSIQRRTTGGCSYLEFIGRFYGAEFKA